MKLAAAAAKLAVGEPEVELAAHLFTTPQNGRQETGPEPEGGVEAVRHDDALLSQRLGHCLLAVRRTSRRLRRAGSSSGCGCWREAQAAPTTRRRVGRATSRRHARRAMKGVHVGPGRARHRDPCAARQRPSPTRRRQWLSNGARAPNGRAQTSPMLAAPCRRAAACRADVVARVGRGRGIISSVWSSSSEARGARRLTPRGLRSPPSGSKTSRWAA